MSSDTGGCSIDRSFCGAMRGARYWKIALTAAQIKVAAMGRPDAAAGHTMGIPLGAIPLSLRLPW